VTQSASVLALPATPNLAVSASTVCLGTNIVFRVTVPESGATYTWSGAAGMASGTGDGTYTVSGATTGTVSVSAYARQTSNGTTCQSGNTSLSAYVSQPGANGAPEDVTCGCSSPYVPCSGVCRSTCTATSSPSCYLNGIMITSKGVPFVAASGCQVGATAAGYSYYYFVDAPSLYSDSECWVCN
jgi:hypothetical protein